MTFKKFTCSAVNIHLTIFFMVMLALLNFFNIDVHSRSGIHKADTSTGLILLVVALLIYVFSRLLCNFKEETAYKCISCGNVFDELSIKVYRCEYCKNGLIDIEDYYAEKNEPRQIYVKVLNNETEEWKQVKALHQIENQFKIINKNENIDCEKWQFNFDDTVKCKIKKFNNNEIHLIAYEKL